MKTTKFALFIITIALFLAIFDLATYTQAGNLLTIKDELSSSQLSYFARMDTGVTSGQGIASVDLVTSTNPSKTTINLFVGDSISIGSTNGSGNKILTSYSVIDVGNTKQFTVSPNLAVDDNIAGQAIIATRSAIHAISFTPITGINAGKFQFLLKTSNNLTVGETDSNGENGRDGIPDQNGFDVGANSPVGTGSSSGLGSNVDATDVICPSSLSGVASVGTTVQIGAYTYHNFQCDYSGTNSSGVGNSYTITVGRSLSTGSQIINPSPGTNHSNGSTINLNTGQNTDIYSYYIRHLNGSTVVDATQGKVAVLEAVKISATVDPTLSLTIDNYTGIGATGVGVMATGTTICGTPMSSGQENTDGTSVRFGSLVIDNFRTMAQRISTATNAPSGYVLTAYQDRYMTASNTGSTIPNTSCDSSCSDTASSEWVVATNYGLGYSLANLDLGATSVAFSHNESSRTFSAKRFGFGSSNARTIMSQSSTPSTTNRAYICYRISISPLQVSGDYESRVIYTATATF